MDTQNTQYRSYESGKLYQHKASKTERATRFLGKIAICLLLIIPTLYFALPDIYYRLYNRLAGTYRPEPGEQFDGIDISHHNGTINWHLVAANKNIAFVYMKATEGYQHADSNYEQNLLAAKQLELKVGSYHMLTTKSPVRLQFESFKATALREQQDLIPILDLEENMLTDWDLSQVTDSVGLFLQLAQEHYGAAPIIYSNYRYYQQYLEPTFPNHTYFIAKYGKLPPLTEGKNQRPLMWQFTEHGKLAGIPKEVDLSRFANNMTISDILLPSHTSPTPTQPHK